MIGNIWSFCLDFNYPMDVSGVGVPNKVKIRKNKSFSKNHIVINVLKEIYVVLFYVSSLCITNIQSLCSLVKSKVTYKNYPTK